MKTMNMPSFTAENSIYKTTGRYCMATAFDYQNASANVQPALTHAGACVGIMVEYSNAALDRDWGLLRFWGGAFRGLGCDIYLLE
jgi:hypothetical protein